MKTPSLILMTIILCNLSIPINAQILTSRQQKEDFDTLYSLLHQVHPDLFVYQTQKEFEKKHDSIYRLLNKLKMVILISQFLLLKTELTI